MEEEKEEDEEKKTEQNGQIYLMTNSNRCLP